MNPKSSNPQATSKAAAKLKTSTPLVIKKAEGVYITPTDIAQLTRQIPLAMQLNLRSKKASQHLGYHMSRLRGRGMSFAESREYQPGDEIRHIDWRVTARTGVTHTKTFEEERDRPVFLLTDQSSSLFIGSQRCFKAYLAAELAAGFGWIACRTQDRFGGIFIGNTISHVPLKSGRKHWGHFCEMLIQSNQSWDLDQAEIDENRQLQWQHSLNILRQELRPGSLVVIISDFFNHGLDQQNLFQLRRHADVICIAVEDPIEINPPAINGTLRFGGLQWFYKGQGQDRLRLQSQHQQRDKNLRLACTSLGIGYFKASTANSMLHNLEAILR